MEGLQLHTETKEVKQSQIMLTNIHTSINIKES